MKCFMTNVTLEITLHEDKSATEVSEFHYTFYILIVGEGHSAIACNSVLSNKLLKMKMWIFNPF